MAVLTEQRRVRGHRHHVAVGLHPAHDRGLGQTVDQPRVPGTVFAQVDPRTIPVGVVVMVEVMEPPAGRTVGVLVHDRHVQFAGDAPSLVVIMAARVRADRADDRDLGMRGTHRVINTTEPVLENGIDPVLVADAEVFQPERLRMPHAGPLRRPLVGFGIRIAEVNQPQHGIDISGHVLVGDRHRPLAGVLAAHSGGQHRQRLGSDRLAKAEVFVEADAEALMVAPDVEVVGAVFDGTDRVLPSVHVVQSQAMGDAAAGEPHEPRMQLVKRLHQIGAAMLQPLVSGRRFAGDEIHIHHAGILEQYPQRALPRDDSPRPPIRRPIGGRRRGGNGQRRLVFRPRFAGHGQFGVRHRLAVVTRQRHMHRHRAAGHRTRPHGEPVGLPGMEHHAVEPGVLQADRTARHGTDLDARMMGVLLRHRVHGPHAECGERAGWHQLAPRRVVTPIRMIGARVFERAVLDEFAGQAAVGRRGDVLEEDAPQVGADAADGGGVHGCGQGVGHQSSFAGMCRIGSGLRSAPARRGVGMATAFGTTLYRRPSVDHGDTTR